jgi:hypothetical protein
VWVASSTTSSTVAVGVRCNSRSSEFFDSHRPLRSLRIAGEPGHNPREALLQPFSPESTARKGSPVLLRKGGNNKDDRWSEHGLGHLLNPTDPESEDREWIAEVWLGMIRKALGLPTQSPRFEHQPAVGRISITSPAVMRPLEKLNEGKTYIDKIKPFNFLVTCHVKPFGQPPGVNPELSNIRKDRMCIRSDRCSQDSRSEDNSAIHLQILDKKCHRS